MKTAQKPPLLPQSCSYLLISWYQNRLSSKYKSPYHLLRLQNTHLIFPNFLLKMLLQRRVENQIEINLSIRSDGWKSYHSNRRISDVIISVHCKRLNFVWWSLTVLVAHWRMHDCLAWLYEFKSETWVLWSDFQYRAFRNGSRFD